MIASGSGLESGNSNGVVGFLIPVQIVDKYFAQPAISPQEHERFGDGDTRQPGGKCGSPFEFAEMRESFLKALLHDILGVFSPAGNTPRNQENPFLVTFDQDLEGFLLPFFAAATRGRVSSGNTVDKGDNCFLSLDVACEFG